MFILEEPYISKLLLETLERKQFSVFNNRTVAQYVKDYNLNLLEENTAIESYRNISDLKFYSNSENSIDWVLKNFENSSLAEIISTCKNKYKFRSCLRPVYPEFFFKNILLNDLDKVSEKDLKFPFVIKPSVGFLSMGVHKVSDKEEWRDVLIQTKTEIKHFADLFPKEVLCPSDFIIEEMIYGEEYAVDAYYNDIGEPVILNIFKHPFADSEDVSDRIYITSKQIIKDKTDKFTQELAKIGKLLNMKNFPVHVELIEKENGEIIPVEINPMRFAGWCTTDLAYFAYGINVYEYYFDNLKPDWNKILSGIKDKIFYFAMAEVPDYIKKENIESFNYAALKQKFSDILDFRNIDYRKKSLFAIIFGSTENSKEITEILQMKTADFINYKK